VPTRRQSSAIVGNTLDLREIPIVHLTRGARVCADAHTVNQILQRPHHPAH
jgi:hypothetical protein